MHDRVKMFCERNEEDLGCVGADIWKAITCCSALYSRELKIREDWRKLTTGLSQGRGPEKMGG